MPQAPDLFIVSILDSLLNLSRSLKAHQLKLATLKSKHLKAIFIRLMATWWKVAIY
jgi:hypothetical protein